MPRWVLTHEQRRGDGRIVLHYLIDNRHVEQVSLPESAYRPETIAQLGEHLVRERWTKPKRVYN